MMDRVRELLMVRAGQRLMVNGVFVLDVMSISLCDGAENGQLMGLLVYVYTFLIKSFIASCIT